MRSRLGVIVKLYQLIAHHDTLGAKDVEKVVKATVGRVTGLRYHYDGYGAGVVCTARCNPSEILWPLGFIVSYRENKSGEVTHYAEGNYVEA
jgi:hypothetical protein